MAQYTNLTSLAGLHVGDVVIYNTETDIDLAGYKVKFEVIGAKNVQGAVSYGGYSCGTTSTYSKSIVSFDRLYSSCFYLKNGNGTDWRYNRFIVSGNPGTATSYSYSDYFGSSNSEVKGGNGGGNNASRGNYSGNSQYVAGSGGTQTAGGTHITSDYSGYGAWAGYNEAGFGNGGTLRSGTNCYSYNEDAGYINNTTAIGYEKNKSYVGAGGDGWYGGGAGYFKGGGGYGTDRGAGGGGSGYVLTTSSTKPSGYMDNYDFTLTDIICTTGGAQSASASYSNTFNIGVITIVDVPPFDPLTQTKIITDNLGEVTEIIIDQGTTIQTIAEPTHDSKYLFVCWCSDSALTTEYTFGGTATSDFIYLYAKYYQYVPCKTYTNDNNEIVPCKFYRWNGTSFDQIQINYIETVT